MRHCRTSVVVACLTAAIALTPAGPAHADTGKTFGANQFESASVWAGWLRTQMRDLDIHGQVVTTDGHVTVDRSAFATYLLKHDAFYSGHTVSSSHDALVEALPGSGDAISVETFQAGIQLPELAAASVDRRPADEDVATAAKAPGVTLPSRKPLEITVQQLRDQVAGVEDRVIALDGRLVTFAEDVSRNTTRSIENAHELTAVQQELELLRRQQSSARPPADRPAMQPVAAASEVSETAADTSPRSVAARAQTWVTDHPVSSAAAAVGGVLVCLGIAAFVCGRRLREPSDSAAETAYTADSAADMAKEAQADAAAVERRLSQRMDSIEARVAVTEQVSQRTRRQVVALAAGLDLAVRNLTKRTEHLESRTETLADDLQAVKRHLTPIAWSKFASNPSMDGIRSMPTGAQFWWTVEFTESGTKGCLPCIVGDRMPGRNGQGSNERYVWIGCVQDNPGWTLTNTRRSQFLSKLSRLASEDDFSIDIEAAQREYARRFGDAADRAICLPQPSVLSTAQRSQKVH